MKTRILILAAAAFAAPWVAAGPVTYTFSGEADGFAYTLSHTLPGFLPNMTRLEFTLADIVVDPWGPGGTLALTEFATPDKPTATAVGTFITFDGAVFWNGPAFGFNSKSRDAVSFDMEVIPDSFGSWTDGINTVTVSAASATPEPGAWALLGSGLVGLMAVRRLQRRPKV